MLVPQRKNTHWHLLLFEKDSDTQNYFKVSPMFHYPPHQSLQGCLYVLEHYFVAHFCPIIGFGELLP